MYKVSFFICDGDAPEIVKTFTDTSLTNALVFCGNMSWALKRSNSLFRVVVEHFSDDCSNFVFSFISSAV